jgi:1,4-dihydroxy-2-naphthoate octaprenyltransferase
MVWMYVTTILPFAVSSNEWRADVWLFIFSRFFLIYAICILFDRRDREEDKAKGIRSLITYLDEKGIRILFLASIFVFFASTISLLFFDYGRVIIFFLLIPGILTTAIYNYSIKKISDILYYFTLDGLMALSSALTLLMWI